MSPNAANIIAQINKYIRNDALPAFSDFNLNRILTLMSLLADGSGGGGGALASAMYRFNSANFIDPGSGRKTDVIAPVLNGFDIALYWNQGTRYLEQDLGEYSLLPGGGFRILIAGFDASLDNFQFYATIL